MADNEVSKIMWVAIVVALASSVFVIAKPEVTKQTSGVFDKVTQVVKGTNLDGKPAEGGETEVIKGINIVPNSAHAPNSNVNTPGKPVVTDPSKYVETGTADFGVSENNMWGIDANGNMYVWSTDDKPITGNIQGAGLGELMQRANRGDVKTLTFATIVKMSTADTDSLGSAAFGNASALNYLDVTNIDVSEIKNLNNPFSMDSGLEYIDGLDSWDVSNVYQTLPDDPGSSGFAQVFQGIGGIEQAKLKSLKNIENWKFTAEGLKASEYMFGQLGTNTELPSWTTDAMKTHLA